MRRPDPHKPVSRELVGAIIGAEAGAAIGLLALGASPLAPLGLAALGAGIGSGAVRARQVLIRRWVRQQLRGPQSAGHGQPLSEQH
jgi:hypothetical protein